MGELLVIGNGFDLKTGCKTRYSDFFESDWYRETREKCHEWVSYDMKALYVNKVEDFNFTCWDLLFYIESMQLKGERRYSVNWCDVEAIIHKTMINDTKKGFSWEKIYQMLHQTFHEKRDWRKVVAEGHDDCSSCTMYYYLLRREWEKQSLNKDCFYEAVLMELKSFEKRFGHYIGIATQEDNYKKGAIALVKRLVNYNSVQIDSFNYSDFSNERISIRNINGNCENPIFGIDLSDKYQKKKPELIRFTKTSRRVHQDAHNLSNLSSVNTSLLDSAVVFGHSLNKMDYDYFNYLFTALRFNTYEIEKMGTIQFVYSVHDTKRSDEIRRKYANSVYSLIDYYEEYVNPGSQHILINLLRFSGKLRIREI